MSCVIALGGVYYREFDVVNASGPNQGQPVNADTTPAIELRNNGVIVVSDLPTITITNPVTGRYGVMFTVPLDWVTGSQIDVFVNIVLATISYRNGLDSFMVAEVPTDVTTPPTLPVVSLSALQQVYGVTNINNWADADNDGDPTKISNRIIWACNKARLYVESRLAKQFTVPFVTLPALVVEMIVERAGVELYWSPRGLVEGAPELEAMVGHRDNVDKMISSILAGTMVLYDAINDCTQIPKAIKDEHHHRFDRFVQINGVFCPLPDSLFYQT